MQNGVDVIALCLVDVYCIERLCIASSAFRQGHLWVIKLKTICMTTVRDCLILLTGSMARGLYIVNCNWIGENSAFMHSTARHTFHHHTIAIHIITIEAGTSAECYLNCFCCGLIVSEACQTFGG